MVGTFRGGNSGELVSILTVIGTAVACFGFFF